MPASSACSCWRKKPSRRRRAWTSAPTAPGATCALPTPARWGIWMKPPNASSALRLLRLLPEHFQSSALGKYLVGVLGARLVEGTGVHLQRGLGVAEAPLVLAQDLRADLDVDLWLQQRALAAVVHQLLEVIFRHHLHQPPRADAACADLAVARLAPHHLQDPEW